MNYVVVWKVPGPRQPKLTVACVAVLSHAPAEGD